MKAVADWCWPKRGIINYCADHCAERERAAAAPGAPVLVVVVVTTKHYGLLHVAHARASMAWPASHASTSLAQEPVRTGAAAAVM